MDKVISVILTSLFTLLGISGSSITGDVFNSNVQETVIPTHSTFKTIEVDNKKYSYTFLTVQNSKNITLISNLPQKQTSTELKDTNGCTSLINGGFYTETNRHIGLFMTKNIIKQEQSPNATFNGLLWTTTAGSAGIGNDLPNDELLFALQAGPILIDNAAVKKLVLSTDEEARRMIAAVSEKGTIIFLSIFSDQNTFNGPLLEDLPSIVSAIGKKENLNIIQALNLDGGNHSAFMNDEVTIQELSPIGSAFCIK